MKYEEMTAIIKAAKEGDVIELRAKGCTNWVTIRDVYPILFDFHNADYRIGSSPIAAGNNKTNFTEKQIERHKGYRLREAGEWVQSGDEEGFSSVKTGVKWKTVGEPYRLESFHWNPVRTKLPKKKRVKKVVEFKTLPPFFLISKNEVDWLIPIAISPHTIYISNEATPLTYEVGVLQEWKYKDVLGKVKPFVIEVEEGTL